MLLMLIYFKYYFQKVISSNPSITIDTYLFRKIMNSVFSSIYLFLVLFLKSNK